MYWNYIAVAVVANGLGVFGLRILSGLGLAGEYDFAYLTFWYYAGCLGSLVALARRRHRPYPREVGIGAAMAACSLSGQFGMVSALSNGLPGLVVYPVAIAGGLLLVVVVGVTVFRESLSLMGWLGIVLGICSLVMLSV